MKINREKALAAFQEYTDRYDSSRDMIRLKIEHTYRVCGLCQQIARSLELPEEEVDIAWLTGLLHDVGRFEQQTLARFITGGYFTRHLARERTAYKARRDALVAALRTSFAPEELTLAGLHTGLHLLAELRDPPPDDALRAAAEAEGVRLSLLSDYDLTGGGAAPVGTLVLGYGSLADESCPSVGETLKRACTAARESSVRV